MLTTISTRWQDVAFCRLKPGLQTLSAMDGFWVLRVVYLPKIVLVKSGKPCTMAAVVLGFRHYVSFSPESEFERQA